MPSCTEEGGDKAHERRVKGRAEPEREYHEAVARVGLQRQEDNDDAVVQQGHDEPRPGRPGRRAARPVEPSDGGQALPRVERDEDLPKALESAVASGRPALLHVSIDPDLNTRPPGWEQFRAWRTDPYRDVHR